MDELDWTWRITLQPAVGGLNSSGIHAWVSQSHNVESPSTSCVSLSCLDIPSPGTPPSGLARWHEQLQAAEHSWHSWNVISQPRGHAKSCATLERQCAEWCSLVVVCREDESPIPLQTAISLHQGGLSCTGRKVEG